MKLIFRPLILLGILLSSCSPLVNSEFSRSRERWATANIGHYRYSLTVGCFCPFTQKMPLTIEVNDGKLLSMNYSDGSPVPANEMQNFADYKTLDALFDFTGVAMQKADQIDIKYDPTYGFPSDVRIDYIKNAMDDELYLQVQNFEPFN